MRDWSLHEFRFRRLENHRLLAHRTRTILHRNRPVVMPVVALRSSHRVSPRWHRLRSHHTRALQRTRTSVVDQSKSSRRVVIFWEQYDSLRHRMVASQTPLLTMRVRVAAHHQLLTLEVIERFRSRMATTDSKQRAKSHLQSPGLPQTLARLHEDLHNCQRYKSSHLTLSSMARPDSLMRHPQMLESIRSQARLHFRVIHRSAAAMHPC